MSNADKELYEFADFRLDIAERLLLRKGRRVPLPDKAFDTLCVLVRRAGHLVGKDELMEKVWAGAFVEENNLDKNISILRKALGERAATIRGGDNHKKIIETVRGRGYRFMAKTRRLEIDADKRELDDARREQAPLSKTSSADATNTAAAAAVTPPPQLHISAPPNSAAVRVSHSKNVVALAEWRYAASAEEEENLPSLEVPKAAAATKQPAALRTTNEEPTASAAPSKLKFGYYGPAFILSLCAAALAGIGYGFFQFGGSNNAARKGERQTSAAASPADIEIRRLTTESRVYHPAITPDGKYLAYVLREAGEKESVWLKNIASGSAVQIMPAANSYQSLVFSPDGNYLYFSTHSKDDQHLIARIPIFGGAPQETGRNNWGHFALSPDGRQLVFPRGSTRPGETQSLIVVNTETGEERAVVKRASSDDDKFYFHFWGATPSWSPDGQKIAVCGGRRDEKGGWRHTIFEVRTSDGAMSEIPAPRWAKTYQVAWLGDGDGLLVVAREKNDSPYQIWHLEYPSGAARRVTNDLNDYGSLRLTADSRTLVAQQETAVGNIWILPEGDTKLARQLTAGTKIENGSRGLAWTPDGRIIFDSKRTGSEELWAVSADVADSSSGTPQQLTDDANGTNNSPQVTPDGRHIVFVSRRDGKPNIWRMDMDGQNPVRLTDGANDNRPSLSPDGRWVYYTDESVPPATIAKVSIDGGETIKLTKRFNAYTPVVSPDGKMIAYSHFEDATGWVIAIMPAEGGEPFKLLKLKGIFGAQAWAADSKSLIYIKGNVLASNLFRQSIEGDRAPEQITFFKEDRMMSFAYSPDYKRLALTRGNHYSDIVLIDNFK